MANDRPTRRSNGTMLPGHTANTRGRPKKSRNMLTLFNEKRDELVTMKGEHGPIKMTRLEAWVTNMWNKAIACDPKASALVASIMRGSGQLDPEVEGSDELNAEDATILEALIARLTGKKGPEDE